MTHHFHFNFFMVGGKRKVPCAPWSWNWLTDTLWQYVIWSPLMIIDVSKFWVGSNALIHFIRLANEGLVGLKMPTHVTREQPCSRGVWCTPPPKSGKSPLLITKWVKNGVFVGGLRFKSPLFRSKRSTFGGLCTSPDLILAMGLLGRGSWGLSVWQWISSPIHLHYVNCIKFASLNSDH